MDARLAGREKAAGVEAGGTWKAGAEKAGVAVEADGRGKSGNKLLGNDAMGVGATDTEVVAAAAARAAAVAAAATVAASECDRPFKGPAAAVSLLEDAGVGAGAEAASDVVRLVRVAPTGAAVGIAAEAAWADDQNCRAAMALGERPMATTDGRASEVERPARVAETAGDGGDDGAELPPTGVCTELCMGVGLARAGGGGTGLTQAEAGLLGDTRGTSVVGTAFTSRSSWSRVTLAF